jgi:uncharacterized protein YheU (UPF0270 family)
MEVSRIITTAIVGNSDNLQNVIDSVALGSGTSSVYQQQQLQQQHQQQQQQQQQIQHQQILNVPIKQEFIKTIKQEKSPKKKNEKRFMCCYCPWSGN